MVNGPIRTSVSACPCGRTCVSVGAVQTGKFDVVLSGIGPVDAIIDEVQGQPIGPGDLLLHDDASVATVHPDSPDVRVVAPVGPVQVPKEKGRVL